MSRPILEAKGFREIDRTYPMRWRPLSAEAVQQDATADRPNGHSPSPPTAGPSRGAADLVAITVIDKIADSAPI